MANSLGSGVCVNALLMDRLSERLVPIYDSFFPTARAVECIEFVSQAFSQNAALLVRYMRAVREIESQLKSNVSLAHCHNVECDCAAFKEDMLKMCAEVADTWAGLVERFMEERAVGADSMFPEEEKK